MVTKVQRQDSINCMHMHSSKTEQASDNTSPIIVALYTDRSIIPYSYMWTK